MVVLTGGPGCGKSYSVRAIVALARAKRAKVLLAAPTGLAARRLAELAGLEAATLHRLLQLRPGGDAAFDRDHPLDADLVVVDEASMLDVLLANKLGKAIPPGAHPLLVGDVDQLPSVGAGDTRRPPTKPKWGSPGATRPVLPCARPNRTGRPAGSSRRSVGWPLLWRWRAGWPCWPPGEPAAGLALSTRPDHGDKHAALDGAAAPTRQPHHLAGDRLLAYLAAVIATRPSIGPDEVVRTHYFALYGRQ